MTHLSKLYQISMLEQLRSTYQNEMKAGKLALIAFEQIAHKISLTNLSADSEENDKKNFPNTFSENNIFLKLFSENYFLKIIF